MQLPLIVAQFLYDVSRFDLGEFITATLCWEEVLLIPIDCKEKYYPEVRGAIASLVESVLGPSKEWEVGSADAVGVLPRPKADRRAD